ncbi:CDP-glycerol glycerophosphotransferase family protein [Porcipelethomonas sp.]|uniref:CDP-glycerol glycerophosphotransferase family protein n=1 Tax=Porcipelethomonas sp. TaxID=2981675 RepID=UPI003EF166A1
MKLLKKIPRKVFCILNPVNRIIKKDPEQIFIYSNLGFRDNIKALFDYLIANNYNNDYKIVVSLNDYEKYNKVVSKNVEFIDNKKGLLRFFKSKYCFYCFGKYPVKPAPGQIVFNLWHGMPVKRIGNMVKGFEKTDYNYFTHLLCTSEFFRETMKKSFNCDDDSIVICGQPRTDIMMTQMPPVRGREIKGQLFGFERRRDKIILWLPTFRENDGSELDMLSDEQLENISRMCKERHWILLIKPHPLSTLNSEKFKKYDGIKIITTDYLEYLGIDFYKLIKFSECLITDYSSVYFDYMLLDKPMGFVVSDMEKYRDERGFISENPENLMPGDIIKNGKEFEIFIRNIINHRDDYRELRRALNKRFNTYHDNQNCQRVLDTAGITLKCKLY